jgi:hypothetical protein
LLLPGRPRSRIHPWHRTIHADHRIYAHPLSRLSFPSSHARNSTGMYTNSA